MSLAERAQWRVLILDDEPFQLRLIETQLRGLGLTQITCCSDARQALTQWDSSAAPDLLLLDLQMPGLDGVEVMRHLAERQFGGGVVLVSGEDLRTLHSAETLARAHGLRVLGAVAKPVPRADLDVLLSAGLHGLAARPADAVRVQPTLNDLRQALEDPQQLRPHFQPKVELSSGRWVGVETLARWRHPVLGSVAPDCFIRLAEEGGLIARLTEVLLERGVLALMQRWQQLNLPLQLALNVSMDQLVDRTFPDQLVRLLDAAGIAPSRLILEVTESRLMHDVHTTLDILTRLRLKRIGLSIDDFGTGHSSLAQLRDVPFGELKLDKSFVHGAHQREELRILLHATQEMAQQLHMKMVAEGIEDLEDWRQMRAMNCDIGQGYFIGRPMPAEDLDAWLSDWQQRCPALID